MTIYDFLVDLINEQLTDATTKAQQERLKKALEIIENATDCGRFGKVFEILSAPTTSRKKSVSAQGKADIYFHIDGKRVKAEVKTNGGRIENLYRVRKPENAFIVYYLNITTRTYTNKDGSIGGGQERIIEPIILTVRDFLKIVEDCNAVKTIGHKGQNDFERAIQADSKKLYNRLLDYPIPFERDTNYSTDDFEDLIV